MVGRINKKFLSYFHFSLHSFPFPVCYSRLEMAPQIGLKGYYYYYYYMIYIAPISRIESEALASLGGEHD